MKKILIALFLFAGLQVSAQITPAEKGVTYGETVDQSGASTVEEMVVKLATDKKFSGKVQGRVNSVCVAEGCWMKLKQPGGDDIMVKFKDHGFFVPKNIMDKDVVLVGTAKMTTTSIAELKHYAEDAGKSKSEIEKIKDPKREISFIATGVLVL